MLRLRSTEKNGGTLKQDGIQKMNEYNQPAWSEESL